MGEERTCRLCLGTEDLEMGRLIAPCQCDGSMRYIHTACLHNWRTSSNYGANLYACPTCHYQYQFEQLKNTWLLYGLTAILTSMIVFFFKKDNVYDSIISIGVLSFLLHGLAYGICDFIFVIHNNWMRMDTVVTLPIFGYNEKLWDAIKTLSILSIFLNMIPFFVLMPLHLYKTLESINIYWSHGGELRIIEVT
jgi:hypothetical protein